MKYPEPKFDGNPTRGMVIATHVIFAAALCATFGTTIAWWIAGPQWALAILATSLAAIATCFWIYRK